MYLWLRFRSTALGRSLWGIGWSILPLLWFGAVSGFRGQGYVFASVRIHWGQGGGVGAGWLRGLQAVPTGGGRLELGVLASQRVIIVVFVLVIGVQSVVRVVLKLGVLRGGRVLEAV